MFKKLCILLIFSKLKVTKLLIDKYRMHNLYAIFAKLLNICKQIAGNLVNESGNVPRRGVVPKFSDLEVVALNMASEAVGIDSESLLFAKLQEYRVEIPNLISRRQYNDRRKITSSLCNAIRERMVSKMDGGEDYFCIDSKPIEVCRIARSKRCSMGKKDFRKAPGVGYCASQSMYYYGYKLHAVCWLSGIIHSFDLTKASVHDIHYLKDVKVDYSNCTVIGDRGYISAQVQLDLFETANIRLEVPYRCNVTTAKTISEAQQRANDLLVNLQMRNAHQEIFKYCTTELVDKNYFHAVFEACKGLFARIRQLSLINTDGIRLVEYVFNHPILVINSYKSKQEKDEQKGFEAILEGLCNMFRNPEAHQPKIEWPVSEQDALEILSLISYCHRRLDNAKRVE